MSIDWFTFIAQIFNFLVLVALLRWLLYAPIVRAMSQREEKIANRLAEASRKRDEAEHKISEYETKIRELDQQGEQLLKDARRQAQEEQQQLHKDARNEVDQKRAEWHEAYRREQDALVSEIRRQAGRMGVTAARHALSRLADAELEKRVFDVFASRLRQLGEEQREEITRHLGNGIAEISVRSAFDMSDEWRARLRETIRETLGYNEEISFDRSDDLICGLELDLGDYRFGWNMKEFLHDLDLDVGERLRDKE